MRILVAIAVAFGIGAVSGGASVLSAMTAEAVTHIEVQGEMLYSDADKRDLRRLIRSELARAKRGGPTKGVPYAFSHRAIR